MPTNVIVRRFLRQGTWVGLSGGTALGGAIGASLIVLFGLVQGVSVLISDPLSEDFAAVLGISIPVLGVIGAKLSLARLTPKDSDPVDRALAAVVGFLTGGSVGLGPFVIVSLTAYIIGSMVGGLSGFVLSNPIVLTLAILAITHHRSLNDERRYRREARTAAAAVVFSLSGPGLAVLSSVEDGTDWAWAGNPESYGLILLISPSSQREPA